MDIARGSKIVSIAQVVPKPEWDMWKFLKILHIIIIQQAKTASGKNGQER